ncbi:MAG: ArsR family transcriptional regulator [Nitriliruptorales bacterium]|nr:ArsR family transcriptional regulator [Nitriliruptorales bacterium]
MDDAPDGSQREPRGLTPLTSLDDPTRRRLYAYVVAAGEAITRDGASVALDIDRSLVAYHLDKLVDEGLLVASFARPEGRGGPGAGRPAKHYARAEREFAVSVPPRDYRLAAELLTRAAERDTTGNARRPLDRVAREVGRDLGDSTHGDDLMEGLRRHGYEPYDEDGVIRLRNCPFHQLAREHTDLVCGMNLALLGGLTEALASQRRSARLDPAPGRCCVVLEPDIAKGGPVGPPLR